jgi:ElaB/YqjD/DUF883 family membrane-anchored ribosome-binding protein
MSIQTITKRQEIRQQVKQTCTDLASKLEQIHMQVIKPVTDAKEAVTQTVDSAKQVVDTVSEHISLRPWLAVMGSMAAGVGAGLMTGGKPASPTSTAASPVEDVQQYAALATPPLAAMPQPQPPPPGFIQRQLNNLTGLSVGAGLALVRDIIKDHMPAWAAAADKLTADLSEHLGAVPFRGPILHPVEPSPEPVTAL